MPALCSVQTTDAGKPLCESRRVHGGSLRPDEAEASTYSSLPKVTNRICDNSDIYTLSAPGATATQLQTATTFV